MRKNKSNIIMVYPSFIKENDSLVSDIHIYYLNKKYELSEFIERSLKYFILNVNERIIKDIFTRMLVRYKK